MVEFVTGSSIHEFMYAKGHLRSKNSLLAFFGKELGFQFEISFKNSVQSEIILGTTSPFAIRVGIFFCIIQKLLWGPYNKIS